MFSNDGNRPISIREITDTRDTLLVDVEQLYLTALERDEQVPWAWLKPKDDPQPHPRGWKKHLTVAYLPQDGSSSERLAGFCAFAYLPGFGGYISYLAVEPTVRNRGVGKLLYEDAFEQMEADAAENDDEDLPWVIWESREPDSDANAKSRMIWKARMKLFENVGGFQIGGVTLMSPNWLDDTLPSVPLKLFLKPIHADLFDLSRGQNRQLVREFYQRVYRGSGALPIRVDGSEPYELRFPTNGELVSSALALS